MKRGLFILTCLLFIISHTFGQSDAAQTTLYEWNVENVGSAPGERVVATMSTSSVGTYTGASIAGQIIDGGSSSGNVLPTVVNFKLFINFAGSLYGLQQDAVTPDVTLELKSLSPTQVMIVANCPNANTQLRILFKYTTGINAVGTNPQGPDPTLTLGSPTTVNSAGTMLIAQPTYRTDLSGRLSVNVTDTSRTSGYALAVGGGGLVAEALNVKLYSAWPDYVFKEHYRLPGLQDIKRYVKAYHHLPDMPSEQQIARDGLNLGEMDRLLTQKVEELTLYLIDKDRQLQEDRGIVHQQQTQLAAQEAASQQAAQQLLQQQGQLRANQAKIDQIKALLKNQGN